MESKRRAFLITGVGVLGTAFTGCLSSGGGVGDQVNDGGGGGGVDERDTPPDADNDGVPDSADDYPNDPDRTVGETNRGAIDVAEDEWYRWSFDYSEETHIEYEILVRDGPVVDVILFDENEYTYYENGDRAKYYSGLSDLNTTNAMASGWVGAGSYRLVVDNTNYGDARPPTNFDDDVAEIEYTLTVSR